MDQARWASILLGCFEVLVGLIQLGMPIFVIWFTLHARKRIRQAEAEVEELRAHLASIGLPVPEA